VTHLAILELYGAGPCNRARHGLRVSPTKLNDDQLLEVVRSAAERDPAAVEHLFSLLLPRVRNLVRYLVRGDHDVDDLSQDALVMILRGLSSYRGDGTFTSWTDRIVARSVFASLRKRSQAPAAPWDPGQLGQLVSPCSTSGSDFVTRRQLVALLDQLPQEQRVTLVLRHVLGLTLKETAAQTGVPEETARSRLRLGKARLRGLLGDDIRLAATPSAGTRQMVG
jgi:RNA polymerase sigma-70 factor (ECF subfamily)